MIRKLRRRLTIILTVLTGWILIAAFFYAMWTTTEQIQLSAEMLFSRNIDYLFIALEGNEASWEELLQELEKNFGYAVSLEKDGVPMTKSVPEKSSRAQLLQAAKQASEGRGELWPGEIITITQSNGFFYLPWNVGIRSSGIRTETGLAQETDSADAHVADDVELGGQVGATSTVIGYSGMIFPIFTWEEQTYRVGQIQYTDAQQSLWNLVMVENLQAEEKNIALCRCFFIGIMILGLASLTGVNWLLTRLIVKPTEEGLRRQTEFVAAASHELKSPLTVLRGSLSAAEIADTQEEAAQYRHRAEKEAERMGRLISDLLLLAGSDAKNWKMESRAFDIDAMLIETQEQFEVIAREKKHKLVLEIPEETLGEMKGDMDRIHQILSALLDNALEYSPAETTVTLKAEKKKNKLFILVQDEGDGVKEADKSQIFSRFYRADKSRTDKNHFGLGLSVAKELAALHGGTITAENAAKGGAVFTLCLPIEK